MAVEIWRFSCHGVKAGGDYENIYRQEKYKVSMCYELLKICKVSEDNASTISWKAFETTNKNNPGWKQTWIAKHNHQIGANMKNLNTQNHSKHGKCLSCKARETADHIFQYESKSAEKTFTNAIMEALWEKFKSIMSKPILQAIISTIKSICYRIRVNLEGINQLNVRYAAYRQQSLGLQAFMAGLWVTQREEIQAAYYAQFGFRNCLSIWMIKVISDVQNVLLQL